MSDNKYKKCFSIISNELSEFEKVLNVNFSNKSFANDLNDFISRSKKIRFLVSILLLKAFDKNIQTKHLENLANVELLHNATLLHDDVLDKAMTRRGKKSFNLSHGDNFAILSGDYLFSEVIEKIIELKSKTLQKMYSDAIKTLITGEIEQNYSKFKILEIEKYIEKTRKKTAALFELAINSSFVLCGKDCSKDELEQVKEFSKNFGIAFQICDDLKNYKQNTSSQSDIQQGIYTAPVIFEYFLCTQKNISDIIKSKSLIGIEKTEALINYYFEQALKIIEMKNNAYSDGLRDLISLIKE